jgi:hypothetical protein
MQNKVTNIVLILKKGGDFNFQDVYLLVTHINKYWIGGNKPFIYCYTDLVTEQQSLVGLTLRPLPHPEWAGWWSKMNLFGKKLQDLRPFLYIDLDTAILDNIASILPAENERNHFITLRDFYRPAHLASGVMWVPRTAYMDKVYSTWLSDTKSHISKFRGDQNFIESVVKSDLYWQDIFPNEIITTFKPNRQWRTEFPLGSKVVCFHGTPRIREAANSVEWVKQYLNYAI